MMKQVVYQSHMTSNDEAVAAEIVDSAYHVHKGVGPGILESAYHPCLIYELRGRGLVVEAQLSLPIRYKDLLIPRGYRVDLLVEQCVIVEIKAITNIMPIHEAQLLTYLRLTDIRLGILINFHAPLLKEGIRRLINSRSLASLEMRPETDQ